MIFTDHNLSRINLARVEGIVDNRNKPISLSNIKIDTILCYPDLIICPTMQIKNLNVRSSISTVENYIAVGKLAHLYIVQNSTFIY